MAPDISTQPVNNAFETELKSRYQTLDEGVNNEGVYVGEQVVFKLLAKTPECKADIRFYQTLAPCMVSLFPRLNAVYENDTHYFVEMERQRGKGLYSYTRDAPYELRKIMVEKVYLEVHATLLDVLERGCLLLDLNSGNIFVDEHLNMTGFVDANRRYGLHLFNRARKEYFPEPLRELFFEESYSVLADLSPKERTWLQYRIPATGNTPIYLRKWERRRMDRLLVRVLHNNINMWRHISLYLDTLKGDVVDVRWLDKLSDNKAFMEAAFPIAREMLRWFTPYN
jgi:hypothetical protein